MVEELVTALSNSWILAYTTANPYVFAVPITSHVVASPANLSLTTYDLKLRHTCDHVLSSGTFTLNTCPRCLGRGYYYDIKINEDGLFDITNRVDKLLQELEKIVLTESNPFHPKYGANLIGRLGQVPIQDLRVVIKQDLIDAVKLLQTLQQQSTGGIYAPDELIRDIVRIDVEVLGQTGLQFQVIVTTLSNKELSFEGTIGLF